MANSSGEFGLASFIEQNNFIQSNAKCSHIIYKFKKIVSLDFN